MMNVLAIFSDPSKIEIGDILLISLISICIVFVILTLIILVCSGLFKGIDAIDGKINIKAKRKENQILDTDKDAQVALIVATLEYHRETGKDAKLLKIEKIDE